MKIILASGSPRRRELLQILGHEVTCIAPNVAELDGAAGLLPSDLAIKNACMKADLIYEKYGLFGSDFILGADTVVVYENQILGKPVDDRDAEAMLAKLSGATHDVITGFCLISPAGKRHTGSVGSQVTFRALTQQEIANYVVTGEPRDKAGAYGAQGGGAALIARLSGSLSNVIGLPIDEVLSCARSI